MLQISLHRERTAAFLSAMRLVTLAFALLHLQASAQGHFRIGLGTAGPPEICERRLSKAECQRIGPSRSNRQIISIFAMSAVGTGSQLDPLHRRKAAPSPEQKQKGGAAVRFS